MRIRKATRKYERWLAAHCAVVGRDLERKHELMRLSAFSFFRGTFYRWMQRWPEVGPDVARAPIVPAVGDLHIENFGTWRDCEGRLAWGVNDFDECAPLPYTIDLVRLAASAILATREEKLRLSEVTICNAILRGYRAGLARHGVPFVLEGQHRWIRHAATAGVKPAAEFWAAFAKLPPAGPALSASARKVLVAALPAAASGVVFKRRVAGAGSLGRPRFVALANLNGGPVAREAKAWLPSAVLWADGDDRAKNYSPRTVDDAKRSPDPTLRFHRRWIVRRLAPDCTRIELADLPRERDDKRLLKAMGAEIANIHLGEPRAVVRIQRHLRRLRPWWLIQAARHMADAITADWREFRA
jgi:Uncharacterized protein conserved in bacteria (DUF2252)